jgi:signal transduction histidine kinase
VRRQFFWHDFSMSRPAAFVALTIFTAFFCRPARAEILWSEPASRVIHATPAGSDILHGAVKRDDTASDALYFKFHVDPLSDAKDEPYYALFQLCEGDTNRLGVGNAMEAWGYSAAYTSETGPSNKADVIDAGEFNLKSAHPEGSGLGGFLPYELPNHNHEKTIVFKVQYVPGGDDLVTVWLDPDLSHGATAENQPENLITKFKANAAFDQIRLRHDGGGNGWIFSDMAVATSFSDFVVVRFWQTWWFFTLVALLVLGAVGGTVRVVEKRKYQIRLRHAEQEHALERERARIAQDLHDDLGSLLTRISLLGGLLNSDRHNPGLVEAHAGKISQAADQTVRSLEEIVWAVRPGSDTLQGLVDYIAHFANELFEGNAIRCRLDLPSDLPAHALPPDLRHNIFLIMKEALTNVLKHAGGSVVHLQIQADDKKLKITIADDGKGFDAGATETNREHNGLENMRRRAAAVGGRLEVTSETGKGTRMELQVNFPD